MDKLSSDEPLVSYEIKKLNKDDDRDYIVTWKDTGSRVQVRTQKSRFTGKGLFCAQELITKGTRIDHYHGTTVSCAVAHKLFATNNDSFWLKNSAVVVPHGYIPGRFINDCVELPEHDEGPIVYGARPNAKFVEKDGTVIVQATKTIYVGEEIFLTYGHWYWRCILFERSGFESEALPNRFEVLDPTDEVDRKKKDRLCAKLGWTSLMDDVRMVKVCRHSGQSGRVWDYYILKKGFRRAWRSVSQFCVHMEADALGTKCLCEECHKLGKRKRASASNTSSTAKNVPSTKKDVKPKKPAKAKKSPKATPKKRRVTPTEPLSEVQSPPRSVEVVDLCSSSSSVNGEEDSRPSSFEDSPPPAVILDEKSESESIFVEDPPVPDTPSEANDSISRPFSTDGSTSPLAASINDEPSAAEGASLRRSSRQFKQVDRLWMFPLLSTVHRSPRRPSEDVQPTSPLPVSENTQQQSPRPLSEDNLPRSPRPVGELMQSRRSPRPKTSFTIEVPSRCLPPPNMTLRQIMDHKMTGRAIGICKCEVDHPTTVPYVVQSPRKRGPARW
ncbi:hypothetical protein DFS34DRAFT_424298 [Phlyctochytrium arcticum]|nr:hypothetical protein DFS34DRAFT_424298 [Phlyctochytrium arcticum]